MSDVLETGMVSLHDPSGYEIDVPGYERQPIELVDRPLDRGIANKSDISFGMMGERFSLGAFGLWVDGERVARTHASRIYTVELDEEVVLPAGKVPFDYTPE